MTVAFVTGCASGIGERAALALARAGVTVAAGVREPGRAAALVEAARRDSLPVELVKVDVCDDASVANAVDEIHRRLGPIDIVVNNAGLNLIAPAELASMEDSLAILNTNVLGPLRVMKAVLPEMRARRCGRIVNVTSAGSFVAIPGIAMYTASKHALDALSAAMANEVLPFGVVITSVAPGTYRTAMVEKGRIPRETYAYSAYTAAVCEKHIASILNGPDPEPVGEAIVRAALDPAPPLRNLVGKDYQALLGPVVALHDGFQSWFAPSPEQMQ
ncbi:MAG: SDR family NAD(P)-dependent oxidoreductase [Reyranella sp.]|nr:SDR family NAD(P)-dependent oxidoreductase [Reyranella sp.]